MLQVGEFGVAAVVAGGVDDGTGFGEVGAGVGGGAFGEGEAGEAEVGVAFVEAEAAAGGEGEGFGEVLAGEGEGAGVGVEGGAGEEAEGDVLLTAVAAEVIDSSRSRWNTARVPSAADAAFEGDKVRAAQGKVIKGDVKKVRALLRPMQATREARSRTSATQPLVEEEVAVEETRD